MKKSENHIISKNWTEDEIQSQYVVELTTTPQAESFDPFSSNNVRLFGQFSAVRKVENSYYEAIRDPLGIGKLFYTETSNGNFVFSGQFTDLFQYGTKIHSAPAGLHVQIGPGKTRKILNDIRTPEKVNEALTLSALESGDTHGDTARFQKKIQERLDIAFSVIKGLEDEGYKIFIALSGGLDSSTIASFSMKHLSDPIACTLDLGKSEDAEKSAFITKTLGIKHLVFGTSKEEILGSVEKAPRLCQDFRDFNVHCAALNLLLARNIREWADTHHPDLGNRIIVLTGDLMNEFACDYEEETVDNTVYYRLPRIGKKDLQRYLIRGLDTSDRELLPFQEYNLSCIQPYAILYDLYASIGEEVLSSSDAKNIMNSFLVPQEILEFIPKSKLRAQVGSKESMGILGLCHAKGINDRSFKTLLTEQTSGSEGQIPIFVGKYDVEKFE